MTGGDHDERRVPGSRVARRPRPTFDSSVTTSVAKSRTRFVWWRRGRVPARPTATAAMAVTIGRPVREELPAEGDELVGDEDEDDRERHEGELDPALEAEQARDREPFVVAQVSSCSRALPASLAFRAFVADAFASLRRRRRPYRRHARWLSPTRCPRRRRGSRLCASRLDRVFEARRRRARSCSRLPSEVSLSTGVSSRRQARGIRTHNPRIWNPLLYRWSYWPKVGWGSGSPRFVCRPAKASSIPRCSGLIPDAACVCRSVCRTSESSIVSTELPARRGGLRGLVVPGLAPVQTRGCADVPPWSIARRRCASISVHL